MQSRVLSMALAASAVGFTCGSAAGQLPDYTIGLVPVPDNVGFFSQTPAINNSGQVAVGVFDINDVPSIFVGGVGTGQLVPIVGTNDRFDVDTVSINNLGTAFYSLDGGTFGIYSIPAGGSPNLLAPRVGTSTSQRLFGNDTGGVSGLTGSGLSNRRYVSIGAGGLTVLESDVSIDLASPLSLLFSAGTNNQGQVAGVVTFGPGTGDDTAQVLRLYDPDGSGFSVLAADTDANPASPVVKFSSVAPAVNDQGQAVFHAFSANAGGFSQIFLSDNGNVVELFNDGPGSRFSDIPVFSPSFGDDGLLAFLAAEGGANRSVYVGDVAGNALRLAGPGDLVDVNGVMRAITSIPLAPAINDRGDVVFIANVSGAGAQLFVAAVPEPASLTVAALGGLGILRRRR
ncbi:MAG: PEP-CTERM sorting domain-containing protein [Phycisphaerae bacterium]